MGNETFCGDGLIVIHYMFLSVLQVSSQNEHTPNTSVIRTNRCDQQKCGKPVEILQRVAVENHIFHKTCFVCAICNSWLNHFNYCYVPDHDKFYCTQHYQDIENASFGLGEDIRHAMGIGPGVQQQFKFTPGLMLHIDSFWEILSETCRIKPWKLLTVTMC